MRGLTRVPWRGAVPVVLTSLCVLGLVAAAVAAPNPPPPAVVLIQPGHWTVDRDQLAALHVHGGTEQVDALVALPDTAAREALSVVQGESEGFVVGRDRAWTFAKSTLVAGSTVPLPASDEEPVGIEAPGGPPCTRAARHRRRRPPLVGLHEDGAVVDVVHRHATRSVTNSVTKIVDGGRS